VPIIYDPPAPFGSVDLTGTTILWRDLTLYGSKDAGRFSFYDWSGWEDLPDARQPNALARPQAHGLFDSQVFSNERHVIVSGRCQTPAERDAMLLELQASFNFHAPDELPLTITQAGRTLTAQARLLRFKPVSPDWGAGLIGWAAEWVCSDPIRYGAPVSVTTGFPVLAGGLEFDLFTDGTTDTGVLEFGAASATGRILVTNPGNEDAWIQFEIAGPLPADGFEIVTVGTGARDRFEGGVSVGSTLLIDTATALVVIDGYADRSGLLTVRDLAPIPPGGSAEYEFVPLGAFSAATLTATITPGVW
jgi:hypothetical protein